MTIKYCHIVIIIKYLTNSLLQIKKLQQQKIKKKQ